MQIDAFDPRLLDVPGPAVAPPDESDGPVFVDESGRRSKKFRRLGWVLAIACACYAATVVIALIGGNSNAPWLLIPGPSGDKKNSSTVEETTVPADAPSGTPAPGNTPGALAPSGAPSAGADKVQRSGSPREPGSKGSAGTSAAPGTGKGSAGTGSTGTSPNPKPSLSTNPGGPGGPGGEEPPSVSPAPSASVTAPTDQPSGPPADQGGQQLAAEGDAP